jgi:sigma-E factor negative regulatory protein RseA
MDTNKKNREYISALMDGETLDPDLELAMAALGGPDGQQAWDTYHHIGDILRAGAAPDLSPGFARSLAERLAAEPLPSKRSATAPESAATAAVAAGPR